MAPLFKTVVPIIYSSESTNRLTKQFKSRNCLWRNVHIRNKFQRLHSDFLRSFQVLNLVRNNPSGILHGLLNSTLSL